MGKKRGFAASFAQVTDLIADALASPSQTHTRQACEGMSLL